MKKALLLILAVTIVTLLSFHSDQVPNAQGQEQLQSANVLIIKGTIIKISDEYFVQGKSPADNFRILNPKPRRLNEIIREGSLVKIEARSVLGDNIEIVGINGTAY